ncbi:Alpha-amylase [hydrothermal vent metagenome]|uniref:Alpha-amylase n=1 Tax=hydrothermal vent metagenome TaxID=652676 RepID=A0A3B1DYN7_9ZZZZ
MPSRIRLILAIHNHQPVGNFDGVFEDAYNDSYLPFLSLLKEYPEIPISLHTSGSLLEWLVNAHPEYVEQVKGLVETEQIEILGGPFYEPILAGIPRRDRVGQIALYSRYLSKLFDTQIRGMWVPERVWEQSFTSDIINGGIEYTILDDYHFRSAGLRDHQLTGYYLTENESQLLKIFPGSERLRYTIPFADPEETINYLRDIADHHENPIVTFGDDGEKFGTWPGTKEHVYGDKWLRRFFDALRENSDWIKVTTLAEAVDHVSPAGTCYLPDSSYREMTEWALPTDLQKEHKHLVHHFEHDGQWGQLKQFMRGGFWRNFRVKYSEANEMYTRMLQVSERLNHLVEGPENKTHPELINEVRTELYRAQCNCSYWHGAFGGLYLPHLRNAVYHHLIAADNIIERILGRKQSWCQIEADDFNLDARKEIRLAGDRLVAFFEPCCGGMLYELDIRDIKHNLLATLNRREEPYHDTVREAAHQQNNDSHDDHAVSIHDLVKFKQPDLDKKLQYDQWMRKSLVDHFLQPELSVEKFQAGEGEVGDFTSGVYLAKLVRTEDQVEVILSREGNMGPHRVHVQKKIALNKQQGNRLEIHYKLSQLPPNVPIHFAVEFNFAGMAAGQSDRYFYNDAGSQLGQLETIHSLESEQHLGLIDEWLGLDASVELKKPTSFWTFPIQTISQSEGGFELVHQSTAVVPHWHIVADETGCWSTSIVLTLDTSAALARQLRETPISEKIKC